MLAARHRLAVPIVRQSIINPTNSLTGYRSGSSSYGTALLLPGPIAWTCSDTEYAAELSTAGPSRDPQKEGEGASPGASSCASPAAATFCLRRQHCRCQDSRRQRMRLGGRNEYCCLLISYTLSGQRKAAPSQKSKRNPKQPTTEEFVSGSKPAN